MLDYGRNTQISHTHIRTVNLTYIFDEVVVAFLWHRYDKVIKWLVPLKPTGRMLV